ncbi:MAG: hypothetical protein ACYDEJ_09510 [Desulfitobacteriaceae bacterium]
MSWIDVSGFCIGCSFARQQWRVNLLLIAVVFGTVRDGLCEIMGDEGGMVELNGSIRELYLEVPFETGVFAKLNYGYFYDVSRKERLYVW